ncbi:MAG: hypothetical protein AVDCRST_MAG31-1513, partial [uncultured Sphingomonas sp.]
GSSGGHDHVDRDDRRFRAGGRRRPPRAPPRAPQAGRTHGRRRLGDPGERARLDAGVL